jgi:hypothetical protein
VIRTIVFPCSLSLISVSAILFELSRSKFPVGSSAIINSGSLIIALPIATLCFSPQLSKGIFVCFFFVSSSSSRILSTFSSRFALLIQAISNG